MQLPIIGTLRDFAKNAFSRRDRTLSLKNPDDVERIIEALGFAASLAGVKLTPLKAVGVGSVFACVRVLTDAISTLPIHLYQETESGDKKARNHRLYSALSATPNEEMTATDLFSACMVDYALRGNAYAEILRDIDGDAIGLYPLAAGHTRVARNQARKLIYQYSGGISPVTFKASDVLHVRGPIGNGIVSTDTMIAVNELIALAVALQDNAARFFGNGSRPGGVLEHPASLSSEAAKRLRAAVEAMSSGDKAYKLMVLEEGMKYNATRSENKDSQFDESRLNQDLNVCRVFGVPPHKIGIMNSQPRANVEQDNISFVTDTVRPICVRFEQAMNSRLLTAEERDQGFAFKFNVDALLRGDLKSRYEAYGVGRQWGFLCTNDIRRKENLTTIDGGDEDFLQPLNMARAAIADDVLLKNTGGTP